MAKLHGLPFLWVIHLFICLFIYSFNQRDPHKPKICLRCIIVQKRNTGQYGNGFEFLKSSVGLVSAALMFTGPAVCWVLLPLLSTLNYKDVSQETFSKPQIKLISRTLKHPCELVQSNFNTAKSLCLEGLLHADALVVSNESRVTLLLLNPLKAFSRLWLLSNPTMCKCVILYFSLWCQRV